MESKFGFNSAGLKKVSLVYIIYNYKTLCVYCYEKFNYVPDQINEMEGELPNGCATDFPDVNVLHSFNLEVKPIDGYWQGGVFLFSFEVPEEYNDMVSYLKINYHKGEM